MQQEQHNPIALAEAYFLKGKILMRQAQYPEALEFLQKSYYEYVKKIANKVDSVGEVYAERARICRLNALHSEAITQDIKALNIFLVNKNQQKIAQTIAYILHNLLRCPKPNYKEWNNYCDMLEKLSNTPAYSTALNTLVVTKSFLHIQIANWKIHTRNVDFLNTLLQTVNPAEASSQQETYIVASSSSANLTEQLDFLLAD